jgi:2',3'-cyclic-nucleotide 2'-phosphodiesterase (5'-nucleotidase family)
VQLTILQVNDVHGYLDLHPELFWEAGEPTYRQAGGYARLATLIGQARAEQPGAVLVCDNGDTLHGTYPVVSTQGQALVPILKYLGFAAMTAHWDFAYGPAVLQQRGAELNYPLVMANVYDRQQETRPFAAWRVVETASGRVGIIGLASNIVDKTMPPAFGQGLRFTSGRKELPSLIDHLRTQEHVDLVVLLSHLGFPQDMQLLAEVSGIDVCLSGHTHNRMTAPVQQGQTLVMQSGSHGSFLGRLDLSVEHGHIQDYHHRLIEVSQAIEPDPEVAALVERALAPSQEELAEVVGQASTAFDRGTALEATMDNLLLAAIAEAVEAPLAFSNGWRYGAPILPGPITLGQLHQIIPVNPWVSSLELTGQELWAMLEENLEHTYARDAFGQMGGYVKRCRGLHAYVRIENPNPHRLQQLMVGGEPVKPDRNYRAAFVTEQGVPAKYGHQRQAHAVRAVDALRQYLARHSPVHAQWHQTIRLI